MKSKIVLSVIGGIALSVCGYAATSYLNAANSVSMKVMGLYLGKYSSGKCGGWQTVFENKTGATAQDFTQSLDIGNGAVPTSSYDCVALLTDNAIGVTTNSNAAGACQNWTGQKIFAPGLIQSGQTATDLDGAVVAQDTDTPSQLYLFFRVGGSGDVFKATDGGVLNQAISVDESTTTLSFKFKASANHSIKDLQEGIGTCTFDDPSTEFAVEQN